MASDACRARGIAAHTALVRVLRLGCCQAPLLLPDLFLSGSCCFFSLVLPPRRQFHGFLANRRTIAPGQAAQALLSLAAHLNRFWQLVVQLSARRPGLCGQNVTDACSLADMGSRGWAQRFPAGKSWRNPQFQEIRLSEEEEAQWQGHQRQTQSRRTRSPVEDDANCRRSPPGRNRGGSESRSTTGTHASAGR